MNLAVPARTFRRGSPIFRRHCRYHAPRLKRPDAELEHSHETAVRLLCAFDLREFGLLEDDNAPREVVLRLADAIPRTNPREPMQKIADFIPGAKSFAHPELRFHEDYRRYLLKNPLSETIQKRERERGRGNQVTGIFRTSDPKCYHRTM